MTEKELIIKAGEELDAKLAEAKKTGNLVVKDATENESVIRSTFEKGEGIFRLFPAFVPRRFGKAGRRLKLHPDDFFDEEDAEVLRFDNFDDAVECCADLNIPFFVDAGNKKLVFWFVRVDDEGYPEIARCTEREFATILAGISAGGMYCPECGTVHWPDGVPPPF